MNDSNQSEKQNNNKVLLKEETDIPQKNQSESHTENPITLNDTIAHNNSSVINYIVQDGESLHNISDKFSISKRLIKSSNNLNDHHVHPGDTLKIYLNVKSLDDYDPINVSLYDPNGKTNHIKGRLSIKDYNLVFHPHLISHHHFKINLFNHLESSIVENPDNVYFESNHHHHHSSLKGHESSSELEECGPTTHSVLSIEYINDQNQLTKSYFTGKKDDIEKYHNKLNKISNMVKEKPDEYKPDQVYDNMNTSSLIAKQRIHHNSINYRNSQKLSKKDNLLNNPTPCPIPKPDLALINVTINGKSNILSDEDILALRKQLPKFFKNSDWKCLFQTRIHGFSLSTLFNKIHHQKPLILLIKTTNLEVIGVFISCEFVISDKYYGNGEIFVFRFLPKLETFMWDIRKISCNRYFILSSLDSISFGASNEEGEGSALYIDKNIGYGYSEACNTFCSPQLTSTKKFQIEDFEMWGLGFNPEC